MKIYKKDDKIIIELDVFQRGKYTYSDGEYCVNNLYGVIAGDEMTISQANYLDYKDSMQEGMPLIHFWGDREEFIKLCKEIGLIIIEHEICDECRKPIYGSSTYKNDKDICFNCELKNEKHEEK